MKRAYEDPRKVGSLGGVHNFAQANDLNDKRAKKILEGVLSYTLHRPRRKKFPTLPTLVFGKDEQWQMDLVDMQKLSRYNQGANYLLTCIDCFSKFAWAQPIKSKSTKEMIQALEVIKKRAAPRHPLKVQTDQGKEFLNKKVQDWFKKQGWYHFVTYGDSKASVVERWHRTLKNRMFRYFTAQNHLTYIHALQPLIDTYNASYHRSIKMAPNQVTLANTPQVWNNLYGKERVTKKNVLPLKVGDRVRLNKKHRPFKKGYLPGWTEEVFIINSVRTIPMISYKVKEWDGTPIKGTFYPEDVQKVKVKDSDVFRIEKVIRRKGQSALVQWKGWPGKYNSWVPINDILHARRIHGKTKKRPQKKTSVQK